MRGDEVLQHGEAFAEVGGDRRLDDLARRLGHQAAHAGELADLLGAAARAGVGHHEDRVEARDRELLAVLALHRVGGELAQHLVGDAVGDLGPDVDDLVVALAVGDQALVVLVLDLAHRGARLLEQLRLLRGDHHVLDGDRDAGLGRELEAEVLQLVGEDDRRLVAGQAVGEVDQVAELLLLHHLVDFGEGDLGGHDLVEQDAADGGLDHLAVHAHADRRVQADRAVIVGDAHLVGVGEAPAGAGRLGALAGHVVQAEDDVLGRDDDRLAVGRREDVVGRHHQAARLDLRLDRQRHVHRHLVAVEVGVVGRADQRMQLDGLALDEDRLERLDAEAVQGRRAVEQHRMLADHLVEDVPHLGTLLLHHLLGALDGGDEAALLELVVDEGLEQLERHLLRQAALVQAQLGADDDDRAAGVVDALAEQVLAEAAALALEHVGQRLERALVRAGDGAAAAAVVAQRVDGLLQHALLVADDDVRRVELGQPLQAVVAVDDAAVEVVEVRGREAAAVERHQRPQIGRDDRDALEDHPLRPIARVAERGHDLEAARHLLALGLAGRRLHLAAQLVRQLLDVEVLEQAADRRGAHLGLEGVAELLTRLAILRLAEQLLVLQGRLARIGDDVRLEIENLLELLQGRVEQGADPARQALEEPDVGDRRRQLDVAHALAADLGLDDLDAALLADDAAVPHALVLAAVALVVLRRAEDLGAEQAVALRLEGAVVDRLRLADLAVRPRPDLLRRGQRDAQRVEGEGILGLLE